MDDQSIEIFVPVFNGATTLPSTLRSVLAQTVPIRKVTVLDNCSTDATPEIARSFPGIHYIRNERNLGCCGNWNRALEIASSDFVAFLHADDLIMPTWHERCLRASDLADSSLRCCILLGFASFFVNRGLRDGSDHPGEARLYQPGELLRQLWKRCDYGFPPTACIVYPRDVFTRSGLFPEAEYPTMADVPYHWKLLLEEPFVYDPQVSVLVRMGAPNQLSLKSRQEFADGALRSFRQYLPRIATALSMNEKRVSADYLFPYWVMWFRWSLFRSGFPIPSDVSAAARAAIRDAGVAGFLQIVMRQAVAGVRRRFWLSTHQDEIMEQVRCLDAMKDNHS